MVTNRDRKSFGSCIADKTPKVAQTIGTVYVFLSAFSYFGNHFAESFRMSKSSWIMDSIRSHEMPTYWFSRNRGLPRLAREFDEWFPRWSLFWVVQDEAHHRWKITTFKLGHPVFDGGIRWCMFPWCFCQNGVNFLRRLALTEKKLIARVAWPTFSLCNMNRPLFPTTLSIVLRHRK